MTLRKIYIEGVVGLTYIYNIEFHAGATIMNVKREGKPLAETTGTPTGREFYHNPTERRIYVAADQPISYGLVMVPDPSTSTDIPVPKPERFYVLFQTT